MSDDRNDLHSDKTRYALDVKTKPGGGEAGELNAQVEHAKEVSADDIDRVDALREARRQHGDVYIVKSDLEDADQREATPGMREQD